MKKFIYLLFGVIVVGIAMTACSDEPSDIPSGPEFQIDSLTWPKGFETPFFRTDSVGQPSFIGRSAVKVSGQVYYDENIGANVMAAEVFDNEVVASQYSQRNLIVIPDSVDLDAITFVGISRFWAGIHENEKSNIHTIGDFLNAVNIKVINGVSYWHFNVTPLKETDMICGTRSGD